MLNQTLDSGNSGPEINTRSKSNIQDRFSTLNSARRYDLKWLDPEVVMTR
jgi:hypothetical protein